MRPRNDTNLERFSLENGRFSFLRLFLRSIAPQKFEAFRSGNRFVFQQNLPNLSLRGGRIFRARRGNLKRDETASRNEARSELRSEIRPLAE